MNFPVPSKSNICGRVTFTDAGKLAFQARNKFYITQFMAANKFINQTLSALLAIGICAVSSIWWMEKSSNNLQPIMQVAYPTLLMAFACCLAALHFMPSLDRAIRLLCVFTPSTLLLADLINEAFDPAPFAANYEVITILFWIPLCLSMALLLLKTGEAICISALVFLICLICGFGRLFLAYPTAKADLYLLLNGVFSNFMLFICLTAIVWLKNMVAAHAVRELILREASELDHLTGLSNRRSMHLFLTDLYKKENVGGKNFFLMLDIDFFKKINDFYGHETGDQVLKNVGATLKKEIRGNDKVARWGGEEFLIIVCNLDQTSVIQMAERLRINLNQIKIPNEDGYESFISVSIGVAICDATDIAKGINDADKALYIAKKQGRNKVVVC